MKLTVLIDNNTLIDRYLIGEPGVSYLIQEGATQVLFDVGYSNAFITNACKMRLDLLQSDCIVLSHGHIDHTGGLDALIKLYAEAAFESMPYKRPQLIGHGHVFYDKILDGSISIGCTVPETTLRHHFNVTLSKTPVWLTDKLVFLGEIVRRHDFENRRPIGTVLTPTGKQPDFMLDDTALAYVGAQGLVIITGCSHAGICNIIDHARSVCGQDKVVDVIGGFHLMRPLAEQLAGTLAFFRKLRPKALHACHCVDLAAKIALAGSANLKEVGVGLSLVYA